MNPPPVIQQPPLDGGTQSSRVSSGTHAPHALGCVPAEHVGGCMHIVSVSSDSQLNGGGLPPSVPASSGGGVSLGGSPLSGAPEASQAQDPPPCPGGPPCGLPCGGPLGGPEPESPPAGGPPVVGGGVVGDPASTGGGVSSAGGPASVGGGASSAGGGHWVVAGPPPGHVKLPPSATDTASVRGSV